jgi:Flp pilus assembly protein TadG
MTKTHGKTRYPRVPGPATMRRLAVDEDGAAYTLSYVMVIPVYMLLICMIMESVLFFTAKLGTVYAAYAAARTASVWSSATTWDKTMVKAKAAATKSMTPFASGMKYTLPKTKPAGLVKYMAAYEVYSDQPVSETYLMKKYLYAQSNTKVVIKGPPTSWDADISATVTYEFPFNIPGIGRIFGKRNAFGYYLPITSTATLPNEGPQDNRKTIGIGYGTLE